MHIYFTFTKFFVTHKQEKYIYLFMYIYVFRVQYINKFNLSIYILFFFINGCLGITFGSVTDREKL